MKYLKRIFESAELTNDTKEVLKDFGLTELEYNNILNFIGSFGYSEVKNALPFITKWWSSGDNFNFGYDQVRQILNFYNSKKSKFDESEKIEDYFLDIIEGNDSIKVKFNHTHQHVEFFFDINEMEDLTSLSKFILMIDEKFKRSNTKYKIDSISNRVDNDIIKTSLRLKY